MEFFFQHIDMQKERGERVPNLMREACRETSETYTWRFEVPCMKRFQLRRLEAEVRRAAG